MSKWRKCSLGDVINLKRGYDLPSRERVDGNYPIVSSGGISGFHKKAMVKAPCVVTGRYGTIGEVFYITQDFWPLNTSLYVQDFKGNNPRFISYFLKTLDLGSQNVAGAVPGVNRNALHMILIQIPYVSIQKKIAAVLSAYDDLIENNDRRITLLEKMAEEIYREWFVRLRFPGHEQATFHKGIPESWEIKKLEDIVELAYGKALKSEDRISGNYPVFGSSGVVGTHKDYLVKSPGIIVGRKGNVGSVHWSERDFYPIDTVYYIKSSLSFYFLFFLLQSLNFINNDAAVPGLNRNQAYSNKFYLPSQSLID
jgi:type I restriction enzyme, S subunit